VNRINHTWLESLGEALQKGSRKVEGLPRPEGSYDGLILREARKARSQRRSCYRKIRPTTKIILIRKKIEAESLLEEGNELKTREGGTEDEKSQVA